MHIAAKYLNIELEILKAAAEIDLLLSKSLHRGHADTALTATQYMLPAIHYYIQ